MNGWLLLHGHYVDNANWTASLAPRTWATPACEHKRSFVGTKTNFTHVIVFKRAQHLQLAECPLRRCYVLENIRHFFESHSLAGAWVSDRPSREENRAKVTRELFNMSPQNRHSDRLGSRLNSLTTQPRRPRSRSACRETCLAMVGKWAKCVAESRTWSETRRPHLRRCIADSCTMPSLGFQERSHNRHMLSFNVPVQHQAMLWEWTAVAIARKLRRAMTTRNLRPRF